MKLDKDLMAAKRKASTDRVFAVLACGASSAVWLWFTSLKPNYIFHVVVPVLALVLGGIGLLVWEQFRVASAFHARRRYVNPFRSRPYAFGVLFSAAAMLSIFFHVPVYARFALSRPAMDAFIANVQENPDAVRPATMRVGSYVIETEPDLWTRPDGALRFHMPGDNETGFTYSTRPIGYPGGNRGDGHSLGGGWYWFSDD